MPDASILLLDDDPDVGLAAQLLLQRRVAPVTCLRRPAELAAAIAALRPALLLLDLNFGPGRTDGAQGLRLLADVQSRPQPPVVVVMTAYADIDLAVQALKHGAFDFITKPWDNVRLVATCREALQLQRAAAGRGRSRAGAGGRTRAFAGRAGARCGAGRDGPGRGQPRAPRPGCWDCRARRTVPAPRQAWPLERARLLATATLLLTGAGALAHASGASARAERRSPRCSRPSASPWHGR